MYYLRVEIEILKGLEAWQRLIAQLSERRAVRQPPPVFA